MFIGDSIFGSHCQHSMIDLLENNSVLICKEYQENIANNYVIILVTSNSSVTAVYNKVIDNIQCHVS